MFHELLLTLLGYGGNELLIIDNINHTYHLNSSPISSSSSSKGSSSSFSPSSLFTDSESQQLSTFLSLGWYSKYFQEYFQKYSLQWHGNTSNSCQFYAYLSALCFGIYEIYEVWEYDQLQQH